MASKSLASHEIWPAPSALTSLIAAASAQRETTTDIPAVTTDSSSNSDVSHEEDHMLALALQVQHNLIHQHDWTDVRLHTSTASLDEALSTGKRQPPTATQQHAQSTPLPRPLITGSPPRHLYIHPDVQIALIKHRKPDAALPIEPALVCPAHLREGDWSLQRLAEVFAVLPSPREQRRVVLSEVLGVSVTATADDDKDKNNEVRATAALPEDPAKRMLLGIVDADSTIVYYWVHDGIVKPRQN